MTAGLDLAALRKLLTDTGVDVHGDLNATLLTGGRSNLTYKVHDEKSCWVVRRPPLSGLTPSAHDIAREYRVTQALESTRVPTAETVALDADGTYLGVQASIVAFVPGAAVRSQDDLANLSGHQIATVTDALVQCLVDLHAVDHTRVGLESFGRPDGFVARQVALWARQWERVKAHDLPDVEQLSRRLADRIPTGKNASAAIIHGDFRIDNTLLDVSSSDPVRAVIDWEMSTIGDPLTDLALMCVYRTPDFDAVLGFPAAWTSVRIPGSDELAERYARRSGRDLADWDFYLALAYFKLAVIAEGIAHRARAAGNAVGVTGHQASVAVAPLVAAGLGLLRQKQLPATQPHR